MYLLDLLYHKRIPLITTVVDGSIFKKDLRLYLTLYLININTL